MIYNFTTKRWEDGPVLPQIRVGPVQPQPSVKVVSTKPFANVKVKNTFWRYADNPTVYDQTGHPYSSPDEFLKAGGKWEEIQVRQKITTQPNQVTKPTFGSFIKELPGAAQRVKDNMKTFVASIPQATARFGASAVLSATGKDKVNVDPNATRFEKELYKGIFGEGSLRSIRGTGEETLRAVGADKLASDKLGATSLGLALGLLDFTGVGGEKNALRAIALSKDTTIVSKILKKIGVADDFIKEYASILAKTNDEADVARIVTHIDDLQKTTKAAKTAKLADPLTTEARKYKSAEEFVSSFTKQYHGSPKSDLQEIGFGTGVRSSPFMGTSREVKSPSIFFSKDKSMADTFARNRVEYLATKNEKGVPTVYERFIDKKGILDLTKSKNIDNVLEKLEISAERELAGLEPSSGGLGSNFTTLLENGYVEMGDLYRIFDDPKLVKKFKDAGYSGVRILEKNNLGESTAIFDPKKAFSKSQLTDIWNKANPQVSPRTAQSRIPQNKQSKKITSSQLATQNLARSVTKRESLRPINIKPVSYADSITKPIISQDYAKKALVVSEAGDIKTPKHYPDLVKDIELKTPKGKSIYKDITGFTGQARDVYRNFKSFFGDKLPQAKKQILDPFDNAKGAMVTEQKALLKKLKAVTDSGIKKGSKESAAVMDYGEKLVTKEDLVKKFGQAKADKIVEADKFFRKEYDQLLDEVNAVRRKIYPNDETKIIPKRQDYYRHFQELSGLSGLKNIFESPANIDPQLVGISAFTTPRSKWLAFAQRRVGFKSDRDAVGGFLEYIPSATYAKHIDPQISNFRRLAQDLAIQTGDSKNANNFIEFLQDFANDLSGKTNAADRFIQKAIPGGRKMMSAINWLNQRVKANTILGNASSTIAQIFNVPQGIASAKQYSVPGVLRTIGSIFTENIPMSQSSFISERYIHSAFNAFDERILSQPKRFAQWSLGVFDELGTKFIWNAHYTKGVARKVADPVKYADDITRSLVAGRGIGEVPLIQKSKIFQLLAPFQLEVGNLWYVMADQVKAKDFGGLAVLFAANFLFNRVAEKVRGSDVTFDPINAIYEGILALQAEEDKKRGAVKLGGRLVGEVASNIPFGQTLASMYPEYGFEKYGDMTREELFGKGDPTRYGSGLLVTKALKDPLFKILPPFGGSQIKKSLEGLGAYSKGRVTTKEGETQFTIDKNPLNLVRSLLFGKYATPEAMKSFDKDNKPTSPMKPTYEKVQELKAQGKSDEAVKLFDGLSPTDQEVYQTYRKEVLKEEKEKIKPKVFETYKKVQQLKAEGKEDKATALYDSLPKLEKEVYKTLKTKYKDTKLEDLEDVGKEKDEPKDDKSFIKDILTYAKALGTDPVTAFNRIIAGEKIKRVDNGTIIVERIPLSESQSVKSTRGSSGTLKLDHTIPLQLGGDNSESNLKLITEEEWSSYTPVENKLGSLLKKGAISKKEAQQLIKDFKEGKITSEEIMSK